MSLSITVFGPSHYFWRTFRSADIARTWFMRPDACSTGGVGFCIPGLHACFMWGAR
jgi:hypothetical protein